jgi:hypothetical protein
VALLTSTTNQVMKDAFLEGFRMGMNAAKELAPEE